MIIIELYYGVVPGIEDMVEKSIPRALFSYHYYKKESTKIRDFKGKVFIDSGAYSAFSLGSKINLPHYAMFIKQCKRPLFSALDVFNRKTNEDNINASLKNLYKLEELLNVMGIKNRPIPVYHYGEPEWLLKKYCDEYDRVGIGGMVPIPTNKLDIWFDSLICRYGDKALLHAFGMTSFRLLKKWMNIFDTADSSTWTKGLRFGMIPFFYKNKMKVVYCHKGSHRYELDKLPEPEKLALKQTLANYDLTQEQIEVDKYSRCYLWIKVYNDFIGSIVIKERGVQCLLDQYDKQYFEIKKHKEIVQQQTLIT